MNNFARAHDRWLEPPDDDPVCEDGCGETLVRDPYTYEWICENKFCPTKFDGVEKEMAEALVEYMDRAYTYEQRYTHMKQKYETLVETVVKNSGLE